LPLLDAHVGRCRHDFGDGMRRCLKFALLWIMALALPLQGLASSGVARCAGEHHAAGSPETVRAHAAAAAQASQAQHEHAGAQEQHARSDTPSSPSGHNCSLCAACSPGFALLNMPLTVALPEAARGIFAAFQTGLARAIADAPERPPRA
jgi:hypothetical protein